MSNALVPELSVTSLTQSLAFYSGVLGFEVVYQRPEEGFAYLSCGMAELMLDQIGMGRDFDTGLVAPARPFGRGINLQIRVDSIAPFLAALGASAIPLHLAPEDRWYRQDDHEVGNRQFIVADPDGYLLRFYQSLGQRPL